MLCWPNLALTARPAVEGDMSRQPGNRLAIFSFLYLVGATSFIPARPGLLADEAGQREAPIGCGKSNPTFSVRAYDFAEAADALTRAEEVATRIFRQAGDRGCLGCVPVCCTQ